MAEQQDAPDAALVAAESGEGPDGACVVRADGKVLSASPAWLRATGHTAERIVGRDVAELFPGGWARDLARREQAEAAREQLALKDRLAMIAASVPGVVCSYRVHADGSASMPISTPAIEDLYGIPQLVLAESMSPVFARVHPDDLDHLTASIADAARSMTRWHGEYRYDHPSKGARWIEGWSMPVRESGGSILWHGFVMDVTERKRAEQAVRESLDLYRSVFTLAPSGVVLNDGDGRIIAFNDQAHRQLAYSREEFARLRLSDVDADEQPDDVRRHIAHIAALSGDEYEVHHRTKSGEVRDVLVRTRPVDLGGKTQFLNVWQDITDRKHAEAALLASDKRKSEFLGILSHELRSPLAPIRNSIYLLERAAPGSEQAARAKAVIRRQTEHLTRLVDDLLDVTRISRGKVELHRRHINLRDIVNKTTDDLHSLFDQSGVALRVEHSAHSPWVEADPTRITQVLGNLLQNAAKFTPSGGTVVVSLGATDAHAELRVHDDGVGMEPAQVDQMFEPFAQGRQSLARTQGGLGLGLALVKGLVELHGGRVRARSDGPGRGAEFLVILPLSAAGATASPERAHGAAPRTRVVLVVEDNADAGDTLAQILASHGHRVHVARDGRSGLALARELRPDVVLCDIGLPDMDGYAVARALRGDDALRSARLIALSGYAQPEDRQRAREAGFDAHVAKPPDPDELASTVVADAG
ncbi:MAG TPA: PAS domain S-box protein [Anaeromyxobacteraceae bacterium]